MGKMDRKVKPELNAPAARYAGDLNAGRGYVDPSGSRLDLETAWTPSPWHEEIHLLRTIFKEEPQILLWAGPKNETHDRIQMLDKILTALAAQHLSHTWLILSDSGMMFKGRTPYEYCVVGGLPAMREVLALLNGWTQGRHDTPNRNPYF
jgi:hypothetical protein